MTFSSISIESLVLLQVFLLYKVATAGTTRTNTYSYTGASQYFTVPYNVFSINATLNGAAGGQDYCGTNSGAYGGLLGYGGAVKTELTVTPQSTLCVNVGGQGQSRPSSYPTQYYYGGFNGGGTSGEYGYGGAGGGGASDIRGDCSDYSTVMVVAGGGGGGKVDCNTNDASNGGYPGGNYVLYCNSATSVNQQGTQTAGGKYGNCNVGDGVSSAGTSEDGGNANTEYGGGGGGGYYGGGGGCDTAGAGGSSYCSSTACRSPIQYSTATTYGNGLITISYVEQAPTSQPTTQPSQPSQKPSCQTTYQPACQQPTSQPSSQPTLQPTLKPTSQPSLQPSNQPTCQPSMPPTCQPSMQPTMQPSMQPSLQPSYQPTCQPSSQPSTRPSLQPSFQPTCQPSVLPTCQPSMHPTMQPSTQPSSQPSFQPTCQPSSQPSMQPSSQPSFQATCQPSVPPTCQPSMHPTMQPSTRPSSQLSHQPTCQPSSQPSMQPSSQPSFQSTRQPYVSPTCPPSTLPTSRPTSPPSMQPSSQPSHQTSRQPTYQPSKQVTLNPSQQPTISPSRQPIMQPSSQPHSPPTSQPSSQPSTRPSTALDPDCPEGTYYILHPQYYECILCSPGYFTNAFNTSTCQSCPLNSYADSFGATACKPCPSGYVSGNKGSTSESDCVNPIINFSFGIISLFLSFLAVFVYIILGRVQRIAFERRRWLVEKCMILYGIVLKVVDEAKCVVKAVEILKRILKSEHGEDQSGFLSQLLKWGSFVLFAILVAVVIIAETIFVATIHVLGNALLLYRAYRSEDGFLSSGDGNSVFINRINDFLFAIGRTLNINSFIDSIAYPCTYVLNILAFNLNTIKVPCSGSQAPINLLLDCFIAAVVLVLINSDSNLLWMARVKSSILQWMPLLTNTSYLHSSMCSSMAAPAYTIVPFVILVLPSPMKISQFLISYVSISEFFSANGHSDNIPNCDASVAIPMDTIEAYLTTVLVIILIPPIIYLYAQVLFPSPMIIASKSADNDKNPAAFELSESLKMELNKWWRLATAVSSVDWFLIKLLLNFGLAMLRIVQAFIVSVGKKYGQREEMRLFQIVFKDPLQGAALPDAAWLHALEYFEPHSNSEWQSEELKWKQQRKKFPTYYSLVQVIIEDAIESVASTSTPSSPPWRLNTWKKWFSLVGCWIVPAQMFYSAEARRIWKTVTIQYCMYFLMSAGYWTDTMVEKLTLIEKFRAFESSIILIEDDPEAFQTMENPLYSRSSILLDSAATIVGSDNIFTRSSDTFSRSRVKSIASTSINNVQDVFVQYLSAMTSCRSVMWQIIPGMTAFAIFAVDTSACPVLVFSKRLRQYLPPLLVSNAWSDAQNLLEIVFSSHVISNWQIGLVACFLWMKNSRLVQFLLNIVINMMSLYLIFTSGGLFLPVCAFLGVQICMGLIKFGRAFVDIHRTFFDTSSLGVDVKKESAADLNKAQ